MFLPEFKSLLLRHKRQVILIEITCLFFYPAERVIRQMFPFMGSWDLRECVALYHSVSKQPRMHKRKRKLGGVRNASLLSQKRSRKPSF